MARTKEIVEKAGKYLGTCWEVQACRPAKRGELVYNANYDRIGPAPDDSPACSCSVIVETLPGWGELLDTQGTSGE